MANSVYAGVPGLNDLSVSDNDCGGIEWDIRQFSEMRFTGGPDFCFAGIFLNYVMEVEFEGFDIGFMNSFENVDDDTSKAVCVEVDFLVIGDLADLTISNVSALPYFVLSCWNTYLTSANVEGREAVMAPPKRSTMRY